MAPKKFNAPVSIPVYLGSGKRGERLRDNLLKLVGKDQSVSEVVVALLIKAEPALSKGLDDGKK